jgi:hypothetical protein
MTTILDELDATRKNLDAARDTLERVLESQRIGLAIIKAESERIEAMYRELGGYNMLIDGPNPATVVVEFSNEPQAMAVVFHE